MSASLALVVGLLAQPVPPPAPAAPSTVVILDDRAVKDEAPPAFLARVEAALAAQKGVRVVRVSAARKGLDPRADKALAACVDEPGCLAAAARDMGGDVVVTARLTRHENASFLALTRVNALRPQITDDAATLVGNDADALKFITEAVAELFPGER